jgi:hypothetical protein
MHSYFGKPDEATGVVPMKGCLVLLGSWEKDTQLKQ